MCPPTDGRLLTAFGHQTSYETNTEFYCRKHYKFIQRVSICSIDDKSWKALTSSSQWSALHWDMRELQDSMNRFNSLPRHQNSHYQNQSRRAL